MMSRGWTPAELQTASEAMKSSGNLSYEEFCEETKKSTFTAYCKDADGNLIKINGPFKSKEALHVILKNDYRDLKVITVLSQEDIDFIKDK
jgi:hypothetical protein